MWIPLQRRQETTEIAQTRVPTTVLQLTSTIAAIALGPQPVQPETSTPPNQTIVSLITTTALATTTALSHTTVFPAAANTAIAGAAVVKNSSQQGAGLVAPEIIAISVGIAIALIAVIYKFISWARKKKENPADAPAAGQSGEVDGNNKSPVVSSDGCSTDVLLEPESPTTQPISVLPGISQRFSGATLTSTTTFSGSYELSSDVSRLSTVAGWGAAHRPVVVAAIRGNTMRAGTLLR
ncbi:hypothetical protein RUND412_004438 [Rhizina undulata]